MSLSSQCKHDPRMCTQQACSPALGGANRGKARRLSWLTNACIFFPEQFLFPRGAPAGFEGALHTLLKPLSVVHGRRWQWPIPNRHSNDSCRALRDHMILAHVT